MRYTILILLFFISLSTYAQTGGWRKNYQYTQAYGHKSDSVLILPKILVDPSLIEDGAIRFNAGLLQLRYLGAWDGLQQANVKWLTDSLLSKITTTEADARYVPLGRTLTLTAGSGISVTGGTQSLAANRTWTITNNGVLTVAGRSGSVVIDSGDIANFHIKVRGLFSAGAGISLASGVITNTGILNQTAVQEAKNFRISGDGYVNTLKAGYPLTLSSDTKIFATSNSITNQIAAFLTYNNNNDAALDSIATIIFNRSNSNIVNLTDTSNSYGYVRSGQILGHLAAGGMVYNNSASIGRPSSGRQVARMIFRAESDFVDNSTSSGSIGFYTKSASDFNAVQRLTIRQDGTVGISVTTTSAMLHVRGASATVGNTARFENLSGTSLLEVANNNTVSLKGAVVHNITTQTANYTVAATDYTCYTATASITYTLPVPTAVGRLIIIKNASAGTISIAMTGGSTVDGSGSTITVAAGASYQLQGVSATNWTKIN
ncbi:hypothetical protein FHW36_10682 [Chitinophaga polysaccharea]|uniref:Uncharacterized protein n=1 Tax=Chitinophaga polysaccharea TaxID=1293035 RepID=A0A561PL74_9BACT|nr:hypothetical protein [Chitinophaga polysaccharea]TWF38859.1 hypothetical protein FHW36_10682 [Chitinophaga polysaccharea]